MAIFNSKLCVYQRVFFHKYHPKMLNEGPFYGGVTIYRLLVVVVNSKVDQSKILHG